MVDNHRKPKLLLIAGYFPPVRISTGSIRPWNLARCLIELGWEVTVVTPKISVWNAKNLDNVEGVKEEIKQAGIKMIYTDHPLKCLAPWRYKVPESKLYGFLGGLLRQLTRFLGIQNWAGWVPGALSACRELQPEDVDVILATGAPFWGFEIAYRLSKRLHKPFVMDYRDLWTNDPYTPVKHKWVAALERRLIKNSTAVTLVSPISAEALVKKFDLDGKKVFTITNGYDKNHLQSIKAEKFDNFSIVFAGGLIPPKRTLDVLFEALSKIKQQGAPCPWKFHYFGSTSEIAKQEILQWGLQNESIVHGNLPRQDVLPIIKGASLNVVLSSNSDALTLEDKGVIPGKVFELIGLNASILPIVPKDSAVAGVMTDVGVKCFASNEVDEIVHFILGTMNGNQISMINQDKYSWDELSKKFDLLLKGVA